MNYNNTNPPTSAKFTYRTRTGYFFCDTITAEAAARICASAGVNTQTPLLYLIHQMEQAVVVGGARLPVHDQQRNHVLAAHSEPVEFAAVSEVQTNTTVL